MELEFSTVLPISGCRSSSEISQQGLAKLQLIHPVPSLVARAVETVVGVEKGEAEMQKLKGCPKPLEASARYSSLRTGQCLRAYRWR